MEYQSDRHGFPTLTDAELLGSPGVLDRPIAFATFPDKFAKSVDQRCLSMRQIAAEIALPTASAKEGLPLLKLATIGDERSDGKCLRHDANVLTVDGIEGDHDASTLSIEQAADLLRRAGVAALLYASPRHTPDKPRWRVLCPLSETVAPDRREELTARLNGVLQGQLAAESFTLSQSYYFGQVAGAAPVSPVLVDGAALDRVSVAPVYHRQPNTESAPAPTEDDGCDEFNLEPDWTRIRSALDCIPASLSREDGWLAVIMALHNASSGSDEGLALADEWSRTCPEKYKRRDLQSDWRSFSRRKGTTRTIATLFDLAKQHGWQPTAKKPAAGTLPMIDPAGWAGVDLPAREWALREWIPAGQATYLTGPGSAGKSLLAQQLATCIAAGLPFLGIETRQARALYLTCEDDPLELHRRQKAICARLGVTLESLSGRLFLASLAGETDTELCTFSDRGELKVSGRFKSLESSAKAAGIAFVALDNVAHLFAGNENVRHDVAAFVSLLNRLAINLGGTVLFIGHPNKAGDSFSGSTAWENQVRSRLYMETPKDADGVLDRDARTLTRQKANYARNGEFVAFRWHEWAFAQDADLPFSVNEAARTQIEDEAFLDCLDRVTGQTRTVSVSGPASNYAPRVFSKIPGMAAVGEGAFERAMYRLLDAGIIANDLPIYKRANRTWATGIGRAQSLHTSPAKSAQTPHKAGAQTRIEPAQTPHKPACSGPPYTTYIPGGPSGGPPEDSTNDDRNPFDWPDGGGSNQNSSQAELSGLRAPPDATPQEGPAGPSAGTSGAD